MIIRQQQKAKRAVSLPLLPHPSFSDYLHHKEKHERGITTFLPPFSNQSKEREREREREREKKTRVYENINTLKTRVNEEKKRKKAAGIMMIGNAVLI